MVLLIVVGLVLLTIGAEGFVRGSASLARRLGISPLVVGLTVVAFGTSSPELVVSLRAALDGRGAISIGNVVGSNIVNIGLILGLSALLFPLRVQARIIRFDVPIMLGATAVLLLMILDDHLGRLEGLLLFAGIVAYVVFTLRASKRESPVVRDEYEESVPTPRGPWVRDAAFTVLGLGGLLIGARSMVNGAVQVAQTFGVPESIIGLTVVAVGTSLPELASSLLAAYRKEADIAVGNVIGSSIFNILGILGTTALVSPLAGFGLTQVDLLAFAGTAVLTLPLLKSGLRITRGEGAFLVALYVGYLIWLLR